MSTRFEYVPATAAVEYVNDDDLDVDDPDGRLVLMLWHDEDIVLHGTHAQLVNLTDRIRGALDQTRT